MDLLALFAITVIGVACFLLLLGGFWMAPWLMVVILVGLLLVLFKIPLFSQDEPLPEEDEALDPEESHPTVPLVKLVKLNRPMSPVGVTAVSATPIATADDAPVNDVVHTVGNGRKALSYRGARYKNNGKTKAIAATNLIECEGRYRGNRSKLFAIKEKLD